MRKASTQKTIKSGKLTKLGPSLPRKKIGGRLYTMPELIRLTGITRKQASHWANIGLLRPTLRKSDVPTGKPTSFYSANDLVKGFIICEMRRAGFTPRQVQKVASNLREHRIGFDDLTAYLLTDGYTVYYASSDNEVIDILKHHRQMLLLVSIHDQVEKIKRVA